MKRESRLIRREDQQEHLLQTQSQKDQASNKEFGSPEEALRHDRQATPIPARVAERLEGSIGQEPPVPSRWWRKLFKR